MNQARLTDSSNFSNVLETIFNNQEPLRINQCRRKGKNEKVLSGMMPHSWSPSVLVLGAGGLKGFLELGSLAKLEEEGILSGVNTFIGVSVGSIISLLGIAGYSWYEIVDLGIDFNLFPDWNKIVWSDIINKQGFISHDKLRDVLKPALIRKYGLVPNFEQFYMFTGKVYISVTYDLTLEKTCYLSYHSHPYMSVIEAAIASSNIPFVFQSYIYRDHQYIDGALGNPYPINIIDDGTYDILGIYISVKHNKNFEDIPNTIDSIIHAPLNEYRKEIIKNSSSRCRHLELYYTMNDVTKMIVDSNERISMFRSGYEQCNAFLEEFNGTIVISRQPPEPIPYIPQSNGISDIRQIISSTSNDLIESIVAKVLKSHHKISKVNHNSTNSPPPINQVNNQSPTNSPSSVDSASLPHSNGTNKKERNSNNLSNELEDNLFDEIETSSYSPRRPKLNNKKLERQVLTLIDNLSINQDNLDVDLNDTITSITRDVINQLLEDETLYY